MKVNLAGVKAGYEAIPSGTYIATVTEGTQGEVTGADAKFKDSPKIDWELTVSQGEHEGRKLFVTTVIAPDPDALFRLKELLAATGKFDNLEDELDFEIEDIIGSTVKVVVGQREYPKGSNEMRNNVKRIRSVGEEDMTEASLLP